MEGREQLKKKFKVANIGYESYRALIDSSVNRKDDGIDIDDRDGLRLAARTETKKLLSFFDDKTDNKPQWFLRMNPDNIKGLDISHITAEGATFFLTVEEDDDSEEGSSVRLGLGTNKPQYTLDVQGTVSMKARVGAFKSGKVPADKKWYTILDESHGLSNCQAYEIIAHINDNDTDRYALTIATLLISKGRRGETIRITRAASKYFWGKFLNKIKFRWKKVYGKYVIQIRARDHMGYNSVGQTKNVYYRVTKLWDKEFENDNYTETRKVKQSKRIKINTTR